MCTPEVWLSERHGCHAPRNATWDAYFTPVRQISMNPMNDGTDLKLVSHNVDILKWNVNESTFEGLERIDEERSIQAYEVGRKLFSEGTPFVWNFFRSVDSEVRNTASINILDYQKFLVLHLFVITLLAPQ